MAAPRQVYTRAMDPIKGFGAALHNLDFSAIGSPTSSRFTDAIGVFGGTIVHLDSNGNFAPGAQLGQMPMTLLQHSLDPDVAQIGDPDFFQATPTGKGSALVHTGGFELETTEFDVSDTTITYNDYLHAPTEGQITGSVKDVAGLLFKKKNWPGGNNAAVAIYTENICGICSKPAAKNHNKVNVIRYWTVYFPGSV